jgi:hypothetical protein
MERAQSAILCEVDIKSNIFLLSCPHQFNFKSLKSFLTIVEKSWCYNLSFRKKLSVWFWKQKVTDLRLKNENI